MPREVATDWDKGWAREPIDAATVDEEARTPRWKAQERLVRERFGSFDGLEVIEIGAGRGINGALYAQRGARVTLLDVLELPLSQAQELYAEHGLDAKTVVGDVFDLPADVLGRFDVAMSFGLCEHFLDARRLAVVRAHLEPLRPGGLAFIGVPNRHAPAYRVWMATMKRTGSWPIGTEEPFTAKELARLARAAGGEPLAPVYGSFIGSVVNHGLNQALFKAGRKGLRVPQTSVPGLDRMGYELLLPVVRPA